MNENKIRRLIQLVEESNIESIEIRPFLRTAIKITKTHTNGKNGTNGSTPLETVNRIELPAHSPVTETAAGQVPSAAEPQAEASHLVKMTAPMVGTFYRSPAPDAPSFVEVGSVVKPGDTVCIIEAMKLMNEIEAEHGGRIVKIEIENSQPVEFGQVLFTIDPTG
jgi:acetyl-CoA carboxylase biotin carboxyl carrier protein